MGKIQFKESEIRPIAIRMNNACERFVNAAMELGQVDREIAEKAMNAYLKAKIIKIDAVGGQMVLKSGQVFDREILIQWAE